MHCRIERILGVDVRVMWGKRCKSSNEVSHIVHHHVRTVQSEGSCEWSPKFFQYASVKKPTFGSLTQQSPGDYNQYELIKILG